MISIYDEVFAPIFSNFTDETDLRSVESSQAGMMTELRYDVTLKESEKVADFMEKMQVASGNNRVLLTRMRGNELWSLMDVALFKTKGLDSP